MDQQEKSLIQKNSFSKLPPSSGGKKFNFKAPPISNRKDQGLEYLSSSNLPPMGGKSNKKTNMNQIKYSEKVDILKDFKKQSNALTQSQHVVLKSNNSICENLNTSISLDQPNDEEKEQKSKDVTSVPSFRKNKTKWTAGTENSLLSKMFKNRTPFTTNKKKEATSINCSTLKINTLKPNRSLIQFKSMRDNHPFTKGDEKNCISKFNENLGIKKKGEHKKYPSFSLTNKLISPPIEFPSNRKIDEKKRIISKESSEKK